jgi:hypothetical protein
MSAAAPEMFRHLRVPCPRGEGTGPAVMCCRHLRLVEGGPAWRVIPSSAGAWGFACDACSAAFLAAASQDDGSGAALDVALALLRPACRHCVAEAKGLKFMAWAGAASDLLSEPRACAACGLAASTGVRSGEADVEGLGVGMMVAALCDACSSRPAVAGSALDPDSSRFIPDEQES